jgi:hypothetical protein
VETCSGQGVGPFSPTWLKKSIVRSTLLPGGPSQLWTSSGGDPGQAIGAQRLLGQASRGPRGDVAAPLAVGPQALQVEVDIGLEGGNSLDHQIDQVSVSGPNGI